MNLLGFALFIALLTVFIVRSHAHNFLTNPRAYNERYSTDECEGIECVNACPNILKDFEMANTYQRPAATWKRGSTVKLAWAKNNHHGGLFRVSLLPMPLMHDRKAHADFAFEYGCWESGEYSCRRAGDYCGTDEDGLAYKRYIQVPDIYEDGVYVLGYVWYGGLHWKKDKGDFGDFYSCAFVRISGGDPVGNSWKATWVPGKGDDIQDGMCLTSSVTPGTCRKACRSTRRFHGWPSEFWYGKQPVITRQMVEAGLRKHTNAKAQVMGDVKTNVVCPKNMCGRECGGPGCSGEKGGGDNCCASSIQKQKKSCNIYMPPCMRSDLPGMNGPLYYVPRKYPVPRSPGADGIIGGSGGYVRGRQGSSGGSQEKEEPKPKDEPKRPVSAVSNSGESSSGSKKGVCSGLACCPASCGKCGGRNCSDRPGGADCCTSTVFASKRSCDQYDPPCIQASMGTRSSPPKDAGKCSGSYCCASSCEKCGGSGCNHDKGGPENCCHIVIKKSGRKCAIHGAPCVL